ncbi:MAG: NAD-dependent malic enzyme [Planctomycetota bacterium]|nr:NAD-dependent malic enzyme [Planctomycetota bacterium]
MDHPIGFDVLRNPRLNKSTAFTEEEIERYKLRGLIPAVRCSQETQMQRVMENLRRKHADIERYIFLQALLARNERLFYRTVVQHIEEIMPLIYTPTVGQACKEYAHIFRQTIGLYIASRDRGRVREILDNWPDKDVRVIVVTDGERILGLGDLGTNGMGIPVGKLALYVACAGIHPHQGMPVTLDVGTNNQELLDDPLYLGTKIRRLRGQEYDDLVEEFVMAVQDAFPDALLQFEDFMTPNAYSLLNRYRDRVLCFNDDIQGTAAVALAGVYASTRLSGLDFADLKVMFLGAGSAATGIADLMVQAFMQTGLDEQQARERLWFVDVEGLLVKGRDDLMEHNLPYAHDHTRTDFVGAIRSIRPHVLIGATGHAGTFTREVVELMAEINPLPTLFALSNPTSHAECTAGQAYEWSRGRAIFASGSPFAPVKYKGRLYRPRQGNNVYIFPGVGLGTVACKARRITDQMLLVAAQTLAGLVDEDDLATGGIYPPLADIRNISLSVAVAVAEQAYAQELAREPRPDDLRRAIAESMYDATY